MKRFYLPAVLFLLSVSFNGVARAATGRLSAASATQSSPRPRLCVLTDIGGDPDDTQSLVRLMVYSNAFDIEGLIATASGTPGD